MKPIPFLWTNDDVTHGRAASMRRQLDFINRFRIPGSFFVIPSNQGHAIHEDSELVACLHDAKAQGHELYQHGHVHTPYESGVPETWMLDVVPGVRDEYDDRRLEIEKRHTVAALVEMIERGRVIWRKTFGGDSPGYRPGWGAFCANLFIALEALGFEWLSWRIPTKTAWQRNVGLWDAPLEFRPTVPAYPLRRGKLVDYPLGSDFAFRVPNEPARIDSMVDLAMQELDYYHQRQWPMCIICHPQGLEYGGGYAVHEKLLPTILESGKVEPMGMKQLHERYRNTALPTV